MTKFKAIIKMNMSSPQQVKDYYNKMTPSYLNIYGDVIQAFRPSDTVKLLDYIGRSAGLNWNLNVLDLGCGVAGPAIHFAKRWNVNIDGITVSELQAKIANDKIQEQKLDKKVHVFLDDYHAIENKSIKDNSYDVVLFLESLGHSDNIQLAIQQAYIKLKNDGVIYIKDFYKKKVQTSNEQLLIDKIISNIDQAYAYNTLDLDEVESCLENVGFRIEFAKPFDFMDDIKVRYYFEQENNIDIFEGNEINPADWLEIKAVKR